MNLNEELSKLLGNTEPIQGFKVMEWLRGVRDANYELSIKDPEAYQKKRDAARRRIDIARKKAEMRREKGANRTFVGT